VAALHGDRGGSQAGDLGAAGSGGDEGQEGSVAQAQGPAGEQAAGIDGGE
jgi:hypothetical protein